MMAPQAGVKSNTKLEYNNSLWVIQAAIITPLDRPLDRPLDTPNRPLQ